MSVITIKGRDFTVEEFRDDPKGRLVYRLTGKRGAEYATMRYEHRPAFMFLVHAKANAFGIVRQYDNVTLTDRDGVLAVAS